MAYIVRALTCVAFAAALFLMGCGVLYLRDFFKGSGKNNLDNSVVQAGTLVDYSSQQEDDSLQDEASQAESSESPEESSEESTEEGDYTYCVVLDPGHGGNDGGTFYGDIVEKTITLSVVEKMQALLLEEEGIKVVLTRDCDEYVSLQERTEISDEANADLFVSIHCNSYDDDSSIHGIECFHDESSKAGKLLAECIIEAVSEIDGLKIRGVKEEDYYVTRETVAPAVLIEMGYLTNATDRANLTDEDYQQLLAEKIVQGILARLAGMEEE